MFANGRSACAVPPVSEDGYLESMVATHKPFSHASLRVLSIAGALAICGAAVVSPSHAAQFNDQAEWAQGYDADARLSVKRSTTPVLSADTFAATEHAIETYRRIVQNGGWNTVPTGRTLQLGANGPAVVALRRRLATSGDLDASSGAHASDVDERPQTFRTGTYLRIVQARRAVVAHFAESLPHSI